MISKKDTNINIRILWVDDDKKHETDALNMMNGIKNFSVEMIHPTEFEKKFKNIQKGDVDLFIVDYYLDQIPNEKQGTYPYRGLEVAGKIKEKFPEYPVYGVSHEVKKGIFGSEKQPAKKSFDKLLTFEQIQNCGHSIYWDAIYYHTISRICKNDVEALLALLKPPQKIKDRIKQVLPDELRNGLFTKDEGNAIAFGRWVQNKLIGIPGFLYNDLGAATHLGMSKDFFVKNIKNKRKVQNAKYLGIFSENNEDLWWVTELNKLVYSSPKITKSEFDNTWELAPIIFNVPEEERSKCIVCKGQYPELVGINISNTLKMAPVHYRCSEPCNLIKRELFFDEIRGYI